MACYEALKTAPAGCQHQEERAEPVCRQGIVRYPAGMAFYDKREWNTARRQALHDSGYRCQRCGNSLVGLGKACHVHHKKELRRAPAFAD